LRWRDIRHRGQAADAVQHHRSDGDARAFGQSPSRRGDHGGEHQEDKRQDVNVAADGEDDERSGHIEPVHQPAPRKRQAAFGADGQRHAPHGIAGQQQRGGLGPTAAARVDEHREQCRERQQHPDARDHLGIGKVRLRPGEGSVFEWRAFRREHAGVHRLRRCSVRSVSLIKVVINTSRFIVG
jgi:hypothetical protein